MPYTYLKIDFLDELENLFTAIFSTVLEPILTDIFQIFVKFFINIVWNFLSEFLIGLFIAACSFLDFLEKIFNVFSGVSSVDAAGKKVTLLEALFQMKGISSAFLYITLMAMTICMIFTIYKTVKSISDMTLDNQNPVSKVLGSCMKAMVTFALIPFLCIFLLQLSTKITEQVEAAFQSVQGSDGTIGTIVFLSASMDADNQTMEKKDLITGETKVKNPGRKPSLSTNDNPRGKYLKDPERYKNLSDVRSDFYVENFNYVAGFAAALVMLFIMAGAALSFVRRMFELLLLYIVSPLYVSTIPLDDGAIFARWRDLFVAKFFSGFGMIFAMKYYLMIVPFLTSSSLILYDPSMPSASMIDSVLRVFLILGGAWAVYKSQSLLLMIFAPEAAMTEEQAGAVMKGKLIGGAAKTAAFASKAASKAAQKAAQKAAGSIPKSTGEQKGDESDEEDSQAYRGGGSKDKGDSGGGSGGGGGADA